ncbi:MAG: glycosyltransferase family 4 protein [Actinobacteria bacterium]|nr:glycosyltransferase family 4 protein [Actinomycetota bacterium]
MRELVCSDVARGLSPTPDRPDGEPRSLVRSVSFVGSFSGRIDLGTYASSLRGAMRHHVRHMTVIHLGGSPARARAAARAADRSEVIVLHHDFTTIAAAGRDTVADFAACCVRPLEAVVHTVPLDPTDAERASLRVLARRARLVVHTAAARARLTDRCGVEAHRITVIRHGASPNHHLPAVSASTHPVVVTVGTVGSGSGVEHTIRAIARLRAAGSDVRYLVAADVQGSTTTRDALADLARRCGVADLVELVPARDWSTLRAVLRRADVVVVPAHEAGVVGTGVLVEALAAGKAIVATDGADTRELARGGAIALVPAESASRSASAINTVLTEPRVRLRMEAAARSAGAAHDWRDVAARFAHVIAGELVD